MGRRGEGGGGLSTLWVKVRHQAQHAFGDGLSSSLASSHKPTHPADQATDTLLRTAGSAGEIGSGVAWTRTHSMFGSLTSVCLCVAGLQGAGARSVCGELGGLPLL